MAKLKVFGGYIFVNGKQVRAIVAATSQKEAAGLTRESAKSIATHWPETGNEIEIETALSKPGVVFVSTGLTTRDFYEFRPNQ